MGKQISSLLQINSNSNQNQYLFLTLNKLNFLIITKDVFTFFIISWIVFNRRKPNWQQSNPTCCLSYTDNTMLDDLVTLTHWGRVTHICVSKLTIIGSGNGLSPGRRQAIIWTNAGILLIRPLGTNFNEISIEILTFSFMKMRLKVSSAKWRPFCLGLNELKSQGISRHGTAP